MTSITEQAHEQYHATPWEIPVWEGSLFTLLDDAARFYPDRDALDFFGNALTYSQIHRQVLKAARVLVDAGVGAGDVVAIALPNCPQALVAFYACMRIGAVAAQHNPLAPASQIHDQLVRHGGRVAIVWEKCADAYPLDSSTRLSTVFTVDLSAHMPVSQRALLALPIKRAKKTRDQLRADVPDSARSWDRAVARSAPIDEFYPHPMGSDRAVILHTSGTNGVPKSAPLTHSNIGTNVHQCVFWVWMLHEGAETFYSLLPYFHAFGLTFFLCAAIRLAATQVVLPKFDAALALDAHRRRPISFFVGVPPMFERILKEAVRTHTDISSIRYSVAGAMPLSPELAERWEETTGGIIVEGYGLSETSPVLMGAPLSEKRRHGVLGVPFSSTQVRLVDLDDPTRDVEDGMPGEIIVKGPQVFEGYLDAPEETASVFTEEGWLRTGDIGVNSDGFITMVDRRKELILSGGFNVYPSQVEDAIRSMPTVRDVAVVGIPRADQSEEITAAILLEEGVDPLTLAQVREWAEKSIAHYALPRQIVFIAEMPRNQMGKILRRRVREDIMSVAADTLSDAARQVGARVQAAQDAVTRVFRSPDDADGAERS